MTVPTTPAEWLPVLAARLDREHPRIVRLRNYAEGRPDLPEMGKNLKDAWERFQQKARTNLGGAAVRSLCNRIRPIGVTVGDSDEHPALAAARMIWRDCRMAVQIRDAVEDAAVTGRGYLLVGVGEDGRPVITREKPEQFYAEPDPVRPWRARAGIKVWRDAITGHDYARVICHGAAQTFTRSTRSLSGTIASGASGDGWSPVDEPDEFDGDPTIGILERKDGAGFLEPHLDVIDRIVLGKLNRLVVTAMQAFRQRAIRDTKPADPSKPDPGKDAEGNDVDLGAMFEPSPGALWELPAGYEIWESQTTDVAPLLAAEKEDAREFGAVTGTPISALIPDGANQSAEGAAQAKEQQVSQAESDIERYDPAVAVVLVYALRILDHDLSGPGDTVAPQWAPAAHVSVSERYAAAVQAKGAGLARRTIARDVLGMSPEQIRKDEADLADEQLAAALLADQLAGPASTSGQDTTAALRAQADALGVLVRAGVSPASAARQTGLEGVEFTGAVPVSLRQPEVQAAKFEEK